MRLSTSTEPASRIRIWERMAPPIGPHEAAGPMLAFPPVAEIREETE